MLLSVDCVHLDMISRQRPAAGIPSRLDMVPARRRSAAHPDRGKVRTHVLQWSALTNRTYVRLCATERGSLTRVSRKCQWISTRHGFDPQTGGVLRKKILKSKNPKISDPRGVQIILRFSLASPPLGVPKSFAMDPQVMGSRFLVCSRFLQKGDLKNGEKTLQIWDETSWIFDWLSADERFL